MANFVCGLEHFKFNLIILRKHFVEALESVMCDVIKIRLKRRDATRSKLEKKLHLRFGNPSFEIGRSTAVLIISG